MASRRIPDERMAVWRRFLEAHAVVIGALEAELLAAHDLPLAWYDVLVALAAAPDRRLRMQDLARSALFSRSGLTRLVDRMVAAGYVTRAPCPDDRRGTYAVCTRAGLAALRAANGVYLAGVAQHFDRHLTDDEVRVLETALGRVVDAGLGQGM